MIRKATEKDIKSIVRHLQNKGIEYNTVEMMKKDVQNNNLYILEEDGKIIGQCAVVPTEFEWLGIKRLCIYNKKNCGKGYARMLVAEVSKDSNFQYCVTPWEDNKAMIKMLTKIGFEYKYTFNEKWLCFLK